MPVAGCLKTPKKKVATGLRWPKNKVKEPAQSGQQ